MPQIIVLGISGLDADLLRVYGPSLPHLHSLMLESPYLELHSTIPPEPVPAWSSIYTGLNPANHGQLGKMEDVARTVPDLQAGQSELFWERAARAGKRVCVLNPLLARRDCSIEGLTLSIPNTSIYTRAGIFPALQAKPSIPSASQLTAFCTTLRERTQQQVNTALEILAREAWDLFFVQLDALDHIQRVLWHYSDPSDPMYPGKSEHTNCILDFYQFLDQIVGHFRTARTRKGMLAVVSSHGHERRCTSHLHINEWLRTQNFLALHSQVPADKAKQQHWRIYWHEALERLLLGYGKRQQSKQSIDQQHTIAQLAEFASTSSSYAGITINRELLRREGRDYERVRATILAGLEQLHINHNPVVNWVRTREQCYQGRYLDLYPDILFALRSDFGVDRELSASLVSTNATHRLLSGTHSANGVFLLENWPTELEIYEHFQPPTVMDVAPTILRLLHLECPGLDGQPLVQPYTVRQLI